MEKTAPDADGIADRETEDPVQDSRKIQGRAAGKRGAGQPENAERGSRKTRSRENGRPGAGQQEGSE